MLLFFSIKKSLLNMAVCKIASNILGGWAYRFSNRNENRTWADKENQFVGKRSVARRISPVWSLSLFSEERHRRRI